MAWLIFAFACGFGSGWIIGCLWILHEWRESLNRIDQTLNRSSKESLTRQIAHEIDRVFRPSR